MAEPVNQQYVDEVLSEIVAVTEVGLNYQDVEARIGAKYFEAFDAGRTEEAQAIVTTWETAKALAQQNQTERDMAVAIAAASRQMSAEFQEQRDIIAAAKEDLEGALEDTDTTHPLVEKAFHAMRHDFNQEMLDSGCWIIEDPATDLLKSLPDATYSDLEVFWDMLMSGSMHGGIAFAISGRIVALAEHDIAALRDKVTGFVSEIVKDYRSACDSSPEFEPGDFTVSYIIGDEGES